MSELVERLARKWNVSGFIAGPPETTGDLTRWWLNAIADELEGEAKRRRVLFGIGHFAGHFYTVRDWLWAAATEEES